MLLRAETGRVTLKWPRFDRATVVQALTLAGFRPVAASNQVRIPVPPGRDRVETAMRALAALAPELCLQPTPDRVNRCAISLIPEFQGMDRAFTERPKPMPWDGSPVAPCSAGEAWQPARGRRCWLWR